MTARHAGRILEYVRDREADLVDLLKHMVDAESPSAAPDSHQLILSVLSEALLGLGFRLRTPRAPNAHRHIFARRQRRDRGRGTQLLVGHYDTVWPLGTTAIRCREAWPSAQCTASASHDLTTFQGSMTRPTYLLLLYFTRRLTTSRAEFATNSLAGVCWVGLAPTG